MSPGRSPLIPQFAAVRPRWGSFLLLGLTLGSLPLVASCGAPPPNAAQAQDERPDRQKGPVAVDVAVAQPQPLQTPREFTGTARPAREVSLRSQVEGQLLRLTVDVGDRVTQGQLLAQVDDAILTASVASEQAELSARRSEIARLQSQLAEAQTQVQRARLEYQQAAADARRFESLAEAGAGTRQQAEQARTEAQSAAAIVRSAEAQVRSRQQEIGAARDRLVAQQAEIAQVAQRRTYTRIIAPLTGYVTTRSTEVGNLLQPGTEVLKLGDFRTAKIVVQVSELELGNIQVGQAVGVRFDAFANQTFRGQVARIPPSANPVSRLIPVEVTVPNGNGRITGGLLARVTFQPPGRSRIVIPESALQQPRREGAGGGPPKSGQKPGQKPGQKSNQKPAANSGRPATPTTGTVFVIAPGAGEQPTVQARSVQLGRRQDSKVEVLTGLQPGDRYVVRSNRPLKDGDAVRLSILSEG